MTLGTQRKPVPPLCHTRIQVCMVLLFASLWISLPPVFRIVVFPSKAWILDPVLQFSQTHFPCASYNQRKLCCVCNIAEAKACWRGCGGKGLLHCWWGCKLMGPLWRAAGRCLKRIKNRVIIWSCYPHSQTYIQRKTIISKDTCTSMFITVLFTITKTRKQPKCPSTYEWVKKTWYICIYIQWSITQP